MELGEQGLDVLHTSGPLAPGTQVFPPPSQARGTDLPSPE